MQGTALTRLGLRDVFKIGGKKEGKKGKKGGGKLDLEDLTYLIYLMRQDNI